MKRIGFIFFTILSLCYLNAQPKRIYIAPDDHTDYMWSGDENTYRQAFLEMLDYYIKLNDSTAREPYPYQSKWNCDGSYWIYTYQKNRSKEQFLKLIEQMRNGKITVPLNTLAGLHGIAPVELTLREMYYAGSLERKYGLDLDLVINMEDQVLPLGLASLWAGSGAKYSWRGICACATKVKGFGSRLNEIYWYKGLDDQKILMKWYSLNWSQPRKEYTALGYYSEARNPYNGISLCKSLMNSNTKYPYLIAGAFGQGWDDLKTISSACIRAARQNSNSEYQVIVSNEIDFFKDFENHYGDILPSETISYGSTEWGLSVASLADVSASIKRSVEKLRAAEALYTFVALKDKGFALDLSEMRQQAWIACGLYFEHDWTSDGKIISKKQRAAWQRKIAKQFNNYVDTLYDLSLLRLGKLISYKHNTCESFFVFNPLSWNRNDYCDYPYSGPLDIHIVDKTTSQDTPFQFINKKNKTYIRIFANNIPSLGYKVFEIQNGSPSVLFDPAATVTDSILENRYYRIAITRQGVISSIIEKASNKECIRSINGLYANDPGKGTGKYDSPLKVENAGPVSVSLVAESDIPVKHISKIILFKDSDRIEIENYITQNFAANTVTFTFSFNLNNPEIWHEEAGSVLLVKPKSNGGHYADSICRLDWLALNHFVSISGNNNGIILSNRDAYFMKTGNSTITNLDYTNPQVKVLAGGQIDAPSLGIPDQDGDSYFENFFALKSCCNSFNPAVAMKFSMEHQNPLVAGKVYGNRGDYGVQYSLLTVSDSSIIVLALKPAEEGIDNGIILRVWNMDNLDSNCSISGVFPIKKCKETTHIETDISDIYPDKGQLKVNIGHNRIRTYRLFF